ncbi:MAG: ATP-dependent DNA helicase, partial [Salinirussus sp.]
MGSIREAIAAGRDVLFEGATGTGKTLAALAPALDYARETDRVVVITTNVHQQMRQFRHEAAAIADIEELRAVVFRGKDSMCHIDVGYRECEALRDTTRDLVEARREEARLEREQRRLLERMQAGDDEAAATRADIMAQLEDVETEIAELSSAPTCDHYRRNLTTATDGFYEWLHDDVRSPDEIYDFAHEQGLCGYELLKEGIEGVDLVICNYHHLLSPNIREHFFRWLGRDPEDVVAVFDEAHNLEDAARDHARRMVTEQTLEAAVEECENATVEGADAASNVLGAFREALEVTYESSFGFGDRERLGETWRDIDIDNEGRRDDLTLSFLKIYEGPGVGSDVEAALATGRAIDAEYEREYRAGDVDTRRECPTLTGARFLDAWMAESTRPGTHPVVSVRRADGGAVIGRAELFNCIPERVTGELFDGLAASVLMSATLRPFDVTETVLGLDDPTTLAYGQQFPPERRRTFAVDTPPLFARRRDEERIQEVVTRALADAVRFTPGNTLAFFPSYAEAERYHERLDLDVTAYLDRPGTNADDIRREFVASEHAVLCTSLWGRLGEGVSYDGEDARTAVVVGVPYPKLDGRMEAIQDAYDAAFDTSQPEGAGWRYGVEVPTIRKTRQALGRVIRSPTDFGVRVLLDGRYTERAAAETPRYAVRGA